MPLDQDALNALRMDRDRVDSRRERGARPVVIAVLAVLLVLVALGTWLALRPSAVLVQVALVRLDRGMAPAASGGAVLSASGYVVAARVATISSKITGQVREVLVEEGMAVSAGQVLARLDDGTARTQAALAGSQLESARRTVAEAQARADEAKQNLVRARSLRVQGLNSESALQSAEADDAVARARLDTAHSTVDVAARGVDLAERNLADHVIRAPYAGVVISKNAQPGEMISPMSTGGFTRTGICTVVDMTSLEVEVDVNEAYINRVIRGQPVEAVLDAYPDWRIAAHVIGIVPTADRQKATVKVKVGFDALDPRFLPDMGVQVAFLAAPAASAATATVAPRRMAPAGAVVTLDGQTVVFVVHDDVVERRAVLVGRASRDEIEVTSGLDESEVVVVAPPAELRDGARVKVKGNQ